MTTRSMATARRAMMMATLVNNIVKLIILLICLLNNVYHRRLLPPGEWTPRGSRAGAMQENFRGGGDDSSPACCSRHVLLTPWFSPLSCRHNWLSCEGFRVLVHTSRYQRWVLARNRPEPTNQISHHSVFWQKPFWQQESQDKEEQTDGLDWKWTLKNFDLIFHPSTPSRQKVNVMF